MRRRHFAVALVLVGLGASLVVAPPVSSAPNAVVAEPWVLQSSVTLPSAHANQGVATIVDARGHTQIVTRGNASVPPQLRRQGWNHIGDPDSYAGYLLDAYQAPPARHAKLFVLTAPDGRRTGYVHRLTAGEKYNNSFAAIAPGGRWFVSGEWGTVRRLLVFAVPELNARSPAVGHDLPLATTITLGRPMRNVQGCAFSSSTTLVCSTDDRRTDLYGVRTQLLSVRLAHPLDGRAVTATTALLGSVPQRAGCFGVGETEGLDIHGSRLLLSVVTPCRSSTVLYTYTRSAGGSPARQVHQIAVRKLQIGDMLSIATGTQSGRRAVDTRRPTTCKGANPMPIKLPHRVSKFSMTQRVLVAGGAVVAAALIGTGAAYASTPSTPPSPPTSSNSQQAPTPGPNTDTDTDTVQSGDQSGVDKPGTDTASDKADGKSGAPDTDNVQSGGQSGDQSGPDTGGADTAG